MHLHLADRMLAQLTDRPSAQDVALASLLGGHWPAFLLGTVAPDVHSLAGIPRQATHFYTMPPAADVDAGNLMLARYPQLARDRCHSPDQAVFVAGYQVHLLVDLAWFREVLVPLFVQPPGLGDVEDRILLHNLTLIVLDQRSRASLPAEAAVTLAAAEPRAWLPFIDDADLVAWRDELAAQLLNDASETVTIYAKRMSIPANVLRKNVNDVQWIQSNLLALVPLNVIEAQLETAVDRSLALVKSYLEAGEF